MFKRVVAGFDESEGSRDALALARKLADRLDADLVIAGVVPAPAGGSLMPALPADAYTNLVEGAKAGLEKTAAEFGASTELIEASSAARGLEELTGKLEGDLLVLGCDRTDPGTVRAGHKARVLMQGSRCAVALAPVGYRDQAGELTEIGAAVDGSPESAHALEAAIEVAGSRKRVRVISVATDLTDAWGFWGMAYALTEMGEASREVTQRIVDESLASLPEGVEADPVVLEGSAAIQLRRYATGNLDLLCIGSRGYGPVRRVLLGSVSSDLLTEVGCPVMVLPRA